MNWATHVDVQALLVDFELEADRVAGILADHRLGVSNLTFDAVRLCRAVPGLGLTLDPSHFFAGENQGQPFDEAHALAYGTGLRAGGTTKEALQVPWGEGPVDFQAVVEKLEAAGYTGYYVAEYLEDFSPEEPLVESAKVLAWLRGFQG